MLLGDELLDVLFTLASPTIEKVPCCSASHPVLSDAARGIDVLSVERAIEETISESGEVLDRASFPARHKV